jgi:tetratricopeptide (TPR) repeat protein
VPYCDLGDALAHAGLVSEAENLYRRAIILDNTYYRGYGRLGDLLRDLGRYSEAEACYRSVFDVEPDVPEAHTALGLLLRRQGRHKDAEESLRRAVAAEPDEPRYGCELADLLAESGRIEEADQLYQQMAASSSGETLAEVLDQYADMLAAQGRWRQAEQAARRALEATSRKAVAGARLGWIMRRQGRFRDAESLFRRAWKRDPLCYAAMRGLIELLACERHDQEALAACARLSESRPDDPTGHIYAAWLLCLGSQPDAALEAADRAVGLAPHRSAPRFARAMALLEKGETREGDAELGRALALARQTGSVASDLETLEELREMRPRRSLDLILSQLRLAALPPGAGA